MTCDEKYFPGNRENLPQWIEIQWSSKLKIFPQNSTVFVKATLKLKYFEKKDDPPSLCSSEIIDCEIRPYVNV